MVLEPPKVESGYIRRWIGQAFELMARSFHIWFGLAVLFTIVSVVMFRLELHPMVFMPVGLIVYFVSIEIAAASDDREILLADIPGFLRIAVIGAATDMWRKRWTLLALCLLAAYSRYSDKIHPHVTATVRSPADLHNIWTWLVGPASPLVSGTVVMLFGALLQGQTFALACLHYPLIRAYELDDSRASSLLYKAFFKNMVAAMFLQFVPLILLLTVGMILPFVAPFLMCFLPALSYVAFREIFIDDKGNREPAKATSKQVVLGAA